MPRHAPTPLPGPSLNSLLAVLTILSLFGFARHLLKNDPQALLVAFTDALSPAIGSVSIEALAGTFWRS
ncbi:MAG: hypothetical protein GTN75_01920 [Gemmatimonadetes bacterium]|nr:hypothetical protein [Gemmatimonadota bacterium]